MNRLMLFFFLAIATGIAINSLPAGNMNAISEDVSGVDIPDHAPWKNTALDCREESFNCSEAVVEKNLQSCNGSWRQGMPESELHCSYGAGGVESVSLVSDAANYVDVPRAETDYRVTQLSRTGYNPWDLEFLPSGKTIWTRKDGALLRETSNGPERIEKLDVLSSGENGLLGMAVDPSFSKNSFVYLSYTFNQTNVETLQDGKYIYRQRVSRFRLVNGSLVDEKVLLTVPASYYHAGNRLEFGPDGKLYVTTGEAYMEYRTVDPEFLGGKILRINSDGSVPQSNPFNNSVYSMGHRNPQGIAWNPETGTLYNTEHGPWRHDELNRVLPGENYGWAYYKCDDRFKKSVSYWKNIPAPPEYNQSQGPAHCWDSYTMAPSGATFVNDTDSKWHGDLFVAGLRGDHLAKFEFDGDQIVSHEVFYVSSDEREVSLRLRDVEYRNGSLYVMGDVKGLVKIVPE